MQTNEYSHMHATKEQQTHAVTSERGKCVVESSDQIDSLIEKKR